MNRYDDMIEEALDTLTGYLNSRSSYAADVLNGYQNWSGSDLKGKARKYGASYKRQRTRAELALELSGGELVRLQPSGKIVAGVAVGMDDYGNEVWQVDGGVVVQDTVERVRVLA